MSTDWLKGSRPRQAKFDSIFWPADAQPGAMLFGRLRNIEHGVETENGKVSVMVFGPSLVENPGQRPAPIAGARVIINKVLDGLVSEADKGRCLVLTFHGVPAGKRYRVYTVHEQSPDVLAAALREVGASDDDAKAEGGDDDLPF